MPRPIQYTRLGQFSTVPEQRHLSNVEVARMLMKRKIIVPKVKEEKNMSETKTSSSDKPVSEPAFFTCGFCPLGRRGAECRGCAIAQMTSSIIKIKLSQIKPIEQETYATVPPTVSPLTADSDARASTVPSPTQIQPENVTSSEFLSSLPWRSSDREGAAQDDEDGWLYSTQSTKPDANQSRKETARKVSLLKQFLEKGSHIGRHNSLLLKINEEYFQVCLSGKNLKYINRYHQSAQQMLPAQPVA